MLYVVQFNDHLLVVGRGLSYPAAGRCCSRCDSLDIRFLTQLLVDCRGQRPPFTAAPWSAQTPEAESKEAVPHGVVVRLDTCIKNGSQLLSAVLSRGFRNPLDNFHVEPVGGISGALAGREGSSEDGVGPAEIADAGGAPTTIVEGVEDGYIPEPTHLLLSGP